MSKRSESVKRWRKNTKRKLVDSFGGKCGICCYNKCYNALEFHHLDPNIKEKQISCWKANPKSWDKIVTELRKCICVCSNCHKEIHDNIIQVPDNIQRFNEDFVEYENSKIEIHTPCVVCGKIKSDRYNTCSYECSYKLRRKINWDNIDLKSMLDSGMSYVQISKNIGCSDRTVKEWADKKGLKSKFSQ